MLRVSVMAMAMLATAQASQGQTFTVLHTFHGGANDGLGYTGKLILTGNMLYGATSVGGSSGQGTIFSFDLGSNNLNVMYSFKGGQTDASGPLALLKSGNVFYGVTATGFNSTPGSVFAYDSGTNTQTVLHNFSDTQGLKTPGRSLVLSGNVLYGLATRGSGDMNYGGIFTVNTETGDANAVHAFDSTAGRPSSLIGSGSLFLGTTTGQYGTIFSLDTANNNQVTTLHTFAGGTDGDGPTSLIQVGTTLYGVTTRGGERTPLGNGTVFSFDTNTNIRTTVYGFPGVTDDGIPPWMNDPAGYYPYGTLIQSGNTLYGKTQWGGILGGGTIFAVDAVTGKRTVLYSFPSDTTVSDLVLSGGILYGTAVSQSSAVGNCIFSLTVPEPCSLSLLLLGSLLLARRKAERQTHH